MDKQRIAIMGRGRMGAGLGLAWVGAGYDVTLLGRDARPVPQGLPLAHGDDAWAVAIAGVTTVVIATPDDAIQPAAAGLAALGVITGAHVVLHLSGLLDHGALAPLAAHGAALGSMHPLMAVPSAEAAPGRLRGAFAVVEGEERAVARARRLATSAGMEPVEISASAKPAYHAAAAMASNFTVTVYDAAVRVAVSGGVPIELALRLYLPLLRGTVENLAGPGGPAIALTGAIRRGDTSTVAAHLAAVGAGDTRRLYLELGWATLALARRAGLDDSAARRIEAVLRGA